MVGLKALTPAIPSCPLIGLNTDYGRIERNNNISTFLFVCSLNTDYGRIESAESESHSQAVNVLNTDYGRIESNHGDYLIFSLKVVKHGLW